MNEIERNYYCIHSHEFNLKNINSDFIYISFKINNIKNNIPNKIKDEIKNETHKLNILDKYKIYVAILENKNYEIFNLSFNKVNNICLNNFKNWNIDVDCNYFKIYNNNSININNVKIIIFTTTITNELFYIGSNNYKIHIKNCLLRDNKKNIHQINIIPYCNITKEFIEIVFSNNIGIIDEFIDTLVYIDTKLKNGCDIFFIAYDDWCNTCKRYMNSIESVGMKAIGLKSVKHPFDYIDEIPVSKSLIWSQGMILEQFPTIINITKNTKLIEGIIHSVKFIHMHAECYFIINNSHINFKKLNKKLIISISGSVYRFQKEKINKYFNEIIDDSIIQSTDLFNKGLKNNNLIHYAIETDKIIPDFSFKDDKILHIGHFPSTSIIKGTPTITNAIFNIEKKYPNKFKYIGKQDNSDDLNKFSSSRVCWLEQLKKYKNCDIYIETLNLKFSLNNPAYPTINQEEIFGEWGNTCLEAAASGCIVMTNCLFFEEYKNEYGNYPGFIIINSKEELEKKLIELINLSREELLLLKKKCYNWALENHSIKQTGIRMYNKIYKKYISISNL
jgi:hypothetical protein